MYRKYSLIMCHTWLCYCLLFKQLNYHAIPLYETGAEARTVITPTKYDMINTNDVSVHFSSYTEINT